MPHRKMDAIKVHHAVVGWQGALSPSFIWLSQGLIETTNGAGTGGDSQQFFCHFADVLSTGEASKHVRQGFGYLRFIASIALKHLRMKGSGTIVFRR